METQTQMAPLAGRLTEAGEVPSRPALPDAYADYDDTDMRGLLAEHDLDCARDEGRA